MWNLSFIACHQIKAHSTRNTHRDWTGGATANGQDPLSHKDHTGTTLSLNVTRTVKPTYERMSDPSLLQRTEQERTQNANECLNGIWPKMVHVGADTVNAVEASSVQF